MENHRRLLAVLLLLAPSCTIASPTRAARGVLDRAPLTHARANPQTPPAVQDVVRKTEMMKSGVSGG